eukprot:SAG31_NODE_4324_length_3357_cov_2.015347_4_plen_180_part_00
MPSVTDKSNDTMVVLLCIFFFFFSYTIQLNEWLAASTHAAADLSPPAPPAPPSLPEWKPGGFADKITDNKSDAASDISQTIRNPQQGPQGAVRWPSGKGPEWARNDDSESEIIDVSSARSVAARIRSDSGSTSTGQANGRSLAFEYDSALLSPSRSFRIPARRDIRVSHFVDSSSDEDG